jgi:hypothetical protein
MKLPAILATIVGRASPCSPGARPGLTWCSRAAPAAGIRRRHRGVRQHRVAGARGARARRPRARRRARDRGPGIRIVLGVLEVLLGGSIVLAASLSIGDPVAASRLP